MEDRKFSREEFTIMQMICEYAHAKHSDQLELFTYFNPKDVNTLGFFQDQDFASEYSREFFDWIFRIDNYVNEVPKLSGYEGDLKKLSEEDKETIVELSDDFFKVFEIEDNKANVEEQGFQVYACYD